LICCLSTLWLYHWSQIANPYHFSAISCCFRQLLLKHTFLDLLHKHYLTVPLISNCKPLSFLRNFMFFRQLLLKHTFNVCQGAVWHQCVDQNVCRFPTPVFFWRRQHQVVEQVLERIQKYLQPRGLGATAVGFARQHTKGPHVGPPRTNLLFERE
jgi:hypothetical protein